VDLFIIFRCTTAIFWSRRNGCGWKHCKIMAGQCLMAYTNGLFVVKSIKKLNSRRNIICIVLYIFACKKLLKTSVYYQLKHQLSLIITFFFKNKK